MGRRKSSILIIDDEPNIIFELTAILEKDYTVFAVIDSREAIETVEKNIPDVILLDIFMPEMDGFEVMLALKKSEKTRDIPVILMTGLDSIDAEEKGLNLGAADYISKPFHSAVVSTRVKNQITIKERLNQQTLMTSISHKFLADAHADTLFADTLKMIGEFMGVAQVLLYEFDDKSGELVCRHEWFAPDLNLTTRIGEVLVIDATMKSITDNLLNSGQMCIHSNVPAYKEATKQYRMRYSSFITSPLFMQGKMCAILDISKEDDGSLWSRSEIDLTVLVSGIFSSVYERNSIEKNFFISEYDLMKYRLTSEALGIALWDMDVVDADPTNPSNVFTWSPEVRQMFGFNNEYDFPNVLQSLTSRLHPDDRKKGIQTFNAHIRDKSGKTPFSIEYRVKLKSGEYKYFHAFGTTQRNNEGDPIRVAGAFLDIDKRKQVQNQSMIMTNIVQNSPDFISYKKIGGDCLYINPAGSTITGFSQDELLKDYVNKLFGSNADSFLHEVESNLLEKGIVSFEYPGMMKDGTDRIYACTSFLIENDAYATIISDVTEEKELEAELNDAHERVMLMLDTSPLCMEIWDMNYSIIDCNEAAVRMFGFSEKQEYKDKFVESCSPEFQPDGSRSDEKGIEYLNTAFEEGYCVFEWMHKMPYCDTRMPSEVVLVRVEYHDESVVVGYTRDLREQNKMIADKIEAEKATYAKSRFLATMSHEIRTPMNAILGISEIELEREKTPPEVKESLHRIYNSGCTLLGLINDLLDLSKIESGNFEIVNVEYETDKLLSDTIQLNIIRINDKPIEFIVKIDEALPKTLIGDELRIKQILNNLLSNAFKYTNEGQVTLKVSFAHTPDGVDLIFSIKDTGVGMTKEQIEKIFDDYSMFNVEANRTTEGIGLGMGITRNLVDMMNGTINIESEPHVGSVFSVHLPQQPTDSSVLGEELVKKLQNIDLLSEVQKVQIVRDHMPYGSVLVADDNEANLFVARGLMAPYGLMIETVLSGYEALDKIHAGNEYDIVFMDYMMPGMDGIESTRLIRETGYSHPIVALTADAVVGQREAFLENGFEDFISKPIDIRQLDNILNKLIRDKYPPEVVNAARSNKTPSEENNANQEDYSDSILSLRKIDDINVDSGMDVMGGLADVYIKTVKITTRLLPETIAKLDDYCEKTDISGFTVEVHGLKSVLNNIGAAALGKTAATLEKNAKEKNVEYCFKSYPEFKEELIKLHEQLNEALPVQSIDGKESADISLLTQVVNDVKAAAEVYDAAVALELIAPHRNFSYNKDVDEMIQNIVFALEEFNCENALEIINELEEKL